MTTTRPYRANRSVDAAWTELARCNGTQFDPDVQTAFRLVCDEMFGVTASA